MSVCRFRTDVPRIKRTELAQFVAQWVPNFSAKDFATPTGSIFEDFYFQVAQDVFGVTDEQISQPKFEALEVLDHVEIYEPAIPSSSRMRLILRLFFVIGVDDAGLRDIVEPTTKRTIYIVRHVLNFMSHHTEIRKEFHKECEKSRQLEENRAVLEGKVDQLRRAVKAKEAEAAEKMGQMETLEADQAKYSNTLSDLERQVKDGKQAFTQHSAEVDRVRQTLSKRNYTIKNLMADISELESKIVANPAQLQRSLEENKAAIEQTKSEYSEECLTARRHAERRAALRKVIGKLRKRTAEMGEVFELEQQHTAIQRSIKTEVSDTEKMEARISDVRSQEHAATMQHKHWSDELVALQRQAAHQICLTQARWQDQCSEKAECEKWQSKQMAVVDANEGEALRLQKQIDATRERHDRQMNTLQMSYTQLYETLVNHHRQMRSAMQEVE